MITMEGEVGEFEFEEEELVDFEGSDYSIGLDDEFGDEEEVRGPSTSTKAGDILLEQVQHNEHFQTPIIRCDYTSEATCYTADIPKVEARDDESKHQPSRGSCSREGAESGEIEEEKDEKEEIVVSQPVFSFDKSLGNNVLQGRARKHFKADLEDGELDDAVMPEAFNYEAEGNMEVFKVNEGVGQERKRRNFPFVAEWQTDEKEKETKEAQLTTMGMRQNHPRGRQSDHSGIFSKGRPSGRGSNMHILGLAHANALPGIMGPRRPLMPSVLGGQIPVQHFGGPIGMSAPIQFQEALAQEQILRSHHAIQFGVAGPGHPALNMDVPPVHPFFGLDYFGPGPRGIMHLQPPHGSKVVPPMNFIGAIDNSVRGQRPIFGTGRSLGRGSCANIGGRVGSIPRNGYGRSGAWPLNHIDIQAVGRGRVRGRPVPFPIGADQTSFSEGNQYRVDQTVGFGQEMPSTNSSKADEFEHDERIKWNLTEREKLSCLNALHDDKDGNNVSSARQGSESKKIRKNGPLSDSCSCKINHGGSNLTKEKIDGNGKNAIAGMQASTSSSREAGSATTNLIQLRGPVQRSRVLTVGGLPEGTPLSVVIEAFEKQGKIMDLKKEERGDVFTLTFSTLLEAVSAKRLLHRSFLAGRQITVEYSL